MSVTEELLEHSGIATFMLITALTYAYGGAHNTVEAIDLHRAVVQRRGNQVSLA